MSKELVEKILDELELWGVKNIVICPSSRNALFVQALKHTKKFQVVSFFEERSAAFYALGLIKRTLKPAVVITTSGTAAAELLPATMEAFYCGLPLILLTTDRPRRYRLTGAPQSAEQVGLFSHYVHKEVDIAADEKLDLMTLPPPQGPIHLNVCLEDPKGSGKVDPQKKPTWTLNDIATEYSNLTVFLKEATFPFVIVSAIAEHEKEIVEAFLLRLGAPVYLEATSGLRERGTLDHLAIRASEGIWETSRAAGYPIDAVIRIGGVPTIRMWRDLDESEGKIKLLSVSPTPFTGASWSDCLVGELAYLDKVLFEKSILPFSTWKKLDAELWSRRQKHFNSHPTSEPALVYHLSKLIDSQNFVYLGNSLPIREWDMAATFETAHPRIGANRGVNGIDGQISTFFGMCLPNEPAWGIFGDLTALYDMSAPWALAQNPSIKPVCVVINNGGGKIFERMYRDKAFQNEHQINFAPLAKLWNMEYALWHNIPEALPAEIYQKAFLIEIVPDEEQTRLFWEIASK